MKRFKIHAFFSSLIGCIYLVISVGFDIVCSRAFAFYVCTCARQVRFVDSHDHWTTENCGVTLRLVPVLSLFSFISFRLGMLDSFSSSLLSSRFLFLFSFSSLCIIIFVIQARDTWETRGTGFRGVFDDLDVASTRYNRNRNKTFGRTPRNFSIPLDRDHSALRQTHIAVP